jgi:ArsR family transcriptional regulator, arsenate/arsenite/antimonite-responsive transcriptional repressor
VKGVARQQIEVLQGRGSRVAGEKVERVVALGRALSDPIRVRMLGMLAAEAADGRGCCGLPDLGAPVSGEGDSPGICVCEFEECFEMGQSRVSYHMRKLKEAGLVREERRGRWSFYSLDREAARDLLADTGKHLSA